MVSGRGASPHGVRTPSAPYEAPSAPVDGRTGAMGTHPRVSSRRAHCAPHGPKKFIGRACASDSREGRVGTTTAQGNAGPGFAEANFTVANSRFTIAKFPIANVRFASAKFASVNGFANAKFANANPSSASARPSV